MFSLANVLGKSQKYKVCKLQAAISCNQCQHLTEAINVTSTQLNLELGQNSGSSTPMWLGQFASWRSCPKDGFAGSTSMFFLIRIHYHCSNMERGGEAQKEVHPSRCPIPTLAQSYLIQFLAVGLELWVYL